MQSLRFFCLFSLCLSGVTVSSALAAGEAPRVQTVAMVSVTDFVTVSATVRAQAQFEARVATPGVVKAVMTAKGDFVEQGQPLAVVEDTLLKLRLETLTEQVELFRKHKADLTQNLADVLKRQSEGQATDVARIQAIFSLRAAEEALTRAEADRQELADFLAKHKVLSPLKGQIAAVDLVTGTTVMPGATLLVVAQRPLLASFLVPEAKTRMLTVGLPLMLENLARQTGPVPGRVAAVEKDEATGLMRVDVTSSALQGQLLHHELSLAFPVGTHEGIVLAPEQIDTVEGKTLVRVKGSGPVMLKISPLRPDHTVEVFSGLRPGDVLEN